MKIKIWLLSLVFLVFGGSFAVIAGNQQGRRVNRWSSPEEIASTIADRANEDEKIQDTKLNKINNKQWWYPKQYQLTNTAEWIRKNIQPYLQWSLYIGLIAATILLIWNGFRLVTNSTLWGGDIKTVKNNIKNILIGVLIMTGFLVIIKLTMAVINMFFSR